MSLVTALLIGRLGDLIVATPMLRALRRLRPEARLRLVTGSLGEEAAAMIPCVDELVSVSSPLSALLRLRRERSELLVDLNPSFSKTAAALVALTPAEAKAGFAKGRLELVFDRRAAAPGEREHMLDRYERLARLLGAPYEPALELRITDDDERRAREVLGGAPSGGPLLLFAAGNFKKRENRWPEEKFVALCDRLAAERPSLRAFFIAGPGEDAAVDALAARLRRPAVVLRSLPLGPLGAVMRRMDLCVMNITGTTHLAAAVGARTYGLYSGYTNAVWRLRGPGHDGAVAADWESCRGIEVEEAFSGVKRRLSMLESRS